MERLFFPKRHDGVDESAGESQPRQRPFCPAKQTGELQLALHRRAIFLRFAAASSAWLPERHAHQFCKIPARKRPVSAAHQPRRFFQLQSFTHRNAPILRRRVVVAARRQHLLGCHEPCAGSHRSAAQPKCRFARAGRRTPADVYFETALFGLGVVFIGRAGRGMAHLPRQTPPAHHPCFAEK